MSGAAGPVSGAATVTVEVFSDVVCPWCLIGRARLERAVAAFTAAEGAPAVDVVYRSFLLEPDAPRDRDGSMTEHLVERMGVGPDVVGRMMDRVAGIAAGEGLDSGAETRGAETCGAETDAPLGPIVRCQ